MRSDQIKEGVGRAPHRSLLKATGLTDNQIKKPIIGIVNSFNEIVPGHIHLETIARAVKDGVLAAGGTPLEFNTIGVCDGIAMGHEGMKYSLASREIIADSVECMVRAHCFDALVFIPQLRQDHPRHAHGGRAAESALHIRLRRPDAVHKRHGRKADGSQQRV